MKKIFVTFGSSDLVNSLVRIKRQAVAMDFFDEIYAYDENDLALDFRTKFKDQLVIGTRGYGYMCWKPQVVLQVMDRMNEGDILLYTDVGCHVRTEGKKILDDYFALADQHEIVGFASKYVDLATGGEKVEGIYKWTKGDLLDYYGIRDNKEILTTPVIESNMFLIKKNTTTLDLLHEWKKPFTYNFSLIDDSPSKSPNLPGFVEHRHDQSIWSIIGNQKGIYTLHNSENYREDFSEIADRPIWVLRDKDYGWLDLLRKSSFLKGIRLKNFFTLDFYRQVLIRFGCAIDILRLRIKNKK